LKFQWEADGQRFTKLYIIQSVSLIFGLCTAIVYRTLLHKKLDFVHSL